MQATPGAAAVPAASPLRLLGLLALVVALVLLCWIALPRAEQFGLLAQLIYPASLGVALVLVFDKATRAWGTKRGAETLREWLLCDLLVFLLVLAFLNLRSVAKPDTYAASFWDFLNWCCGLPPFGRLIAAWPAAAFSSVMAISSLCRCCF